MRECLIRLLMKLLDYWILYLYHFVRFSKQRVEASWDSARLFLSVFIFAFVMDALSTLCLLMIHLNICEEFIEFVRLYFKLIWMTLYILCGIIVLVYYRKIDHVERIENSYHALSKRQRVIVGIIIYLLEIVLPLYLFVSMRLVLFGQVKWWD